MGDAGMLALLGSFIVPCLIGNGLGGVSIVTLLNFGQVTADE